MKAANTNTINQLLNFNTQDIKINMIFKDVTPGKNFMLVKVVKANDANRVQLARSYDSGKTWHTTNGAYTYRTAIATAVRMGDYVFA